MPAPLLTHLRTTPIPLPVDQSLSNLRCFLLAVLKNIVFVRCFGPFGGKGFHFGDVAKPRFLRGFGLQEGARGRKIGILRLFQHIWPKHGPNIAPKMAQHRANMVPRLLGRRPAVRRKPLNTCLQSLQYVYSKLIYSFGAMYISHFADVGTTKYMQRY